MFIRRSEDRGKSVSGDLKSLHSFSYADYHDPEWNRFQSLRAINEETMAPGSGSIKHAYQNVEALILVLDGTVTSALNGERTESICPYQLKKISAGEDVVISEIQPSSTELVHYYQFLVLPKSITTSPKHELIDIKKSSLSTPLSVVYNGLEVFYFKGNGNINLPKKQTFWLQMLKGEISAEKDLTLKSGDGIGIKKDENLKLSLKGNAEFLYFRFSDS